MKPISYKALEDLLDSDDELPSFYNETPDIPAYQNDSRFLSFSPDHTENEQCEKSSTAQILNYIQAKTQKLKKGEKMLIKTGTLKQHDLYCLKCIEKCCSDETIIWFVNYLINKDLQGPYKFLTSCLVGDIITDYSYKDYEIFNKEDRNYKFEIVF